MISRDKYTIKKDSGCWEWKGAKTTSGYGRMKVNNQAWMAHRYSYTIHKGDIGPGLLVLHSCDNPCCINPEHLSVGTQKDNMADCKAKGRLYRPGGPKGTSKVRRDPYAERVAIIRKAVSSGWKPVAIAKRYKWDLLWVHRVIQVELYGNQ